MSRIEQFIIYGTASDKYANKVILNSVLEYIYLMIDDIDILIYDFSDKMSDLPESMILFLEKHKNEILEYIADNPEKSSSYSPNEYFESLVKLVKVLYLCSGHNVPYWDLESLYSDYKEDLMCDYIIYHSLNQEDDDDYYNECVEKVVNADDVDDFRKKLADFFKGWGFCHTNDIDKEVNALIAEFEQEYQENKECIKEEDFERIESYGASMRRFFSTVNLFGHITEILDILPCFDIYDF